MFSADDLLQPISNASPCGDDLYFSPELDAIAQARRFDDPSLDQGAWVATIKEADWGFVVAGCADLLREKSKDLRLAVWLAEAGATTHGLRGLGEAYKVLAGLLREFWDLGLFPESDGGDHEQRIGNLSWILGRTPALLRAIPLTAGSGAFSSLDFELARKQASPRLGEMEAARRNNSAPFCSAFSADALACLEALLELEQAADQRLGADSPGFSAARDALQTLQAMMPQAAAAAGEVDAGGAVLIGAQAGTTTTLQGPLENRNQALAQLRAVAQFFRRTEPHSPISYFADKAADAGGQNLHAWLRTVVKDPGSLAHIEELLGVKPPNE